jgi:hypothetical protein
MNFTAQAWLRPSARLEDVLTGTSDQALSAISFLNIETQDSCKFWADMGYTFLGTVEVSLTLQPMTDESRRARVEALTAKAEQIRAKANEEAAALYQEAAKMQPCADGSKA